jgi:NAD-dependent dihydropyrimidine dehydrogenase PreA subunit
MKRDIIIIDNDTCNGCGICVQGCPEGAIQMIDGKARLVGDLYCDGLGACIGTCPQGAITIEKREAEDYDELKVIKNIMKQGIGTVKAHLRHLHDHGQKDYLAAAMSYLQKNNITIKLDEILEPQPCGCPGTAMKHFKKNDTPASAAAASAGSLKSALTQWPIQLKLLNPRAPYFNDADLVIAADCVPFAYPDFHRRYLKNKALVIFCPKLDDAHEMYKDKLTQIIKNNNIKSVAVVHMEVPCCFGTVKLVEEALQQASKNIVIKDYTISVQGEII